MSKRSFRITALVIIFIMILGVFALTGTRDAYAAGEYPDPESVYIDCDPNDTYNSSKHFTNSMLYYDCSTKSFTSLKPTAGNYAYYNPKTGELLLWNYFGNSIAIEGPIGKRITINLQGKSTITSDRQFCIIAEGHTLEITSQEDDALLTLKDHYYRVDADGAAITNAWDGDNGKDIVISGTARLKVDYSARSRAYGIYTNGSLNIRDSAQVDVNVKFGDYGSGWSAAVKVDKNLNIYTYGRVNFTAAARDLWFGMIGYPVYIGGEFNLGSGAEYVSMSSVGVEPHICNKTIPKYDFSTSGYYDSEETTNTTAARFFRSDYYSPESIPLNGFFFPDPSFRDFVGYCYDTNNDGWVELAAMSSEETFYMFGDRSAYEDDIFDEYDDAYSIKGIEFFTELVDLFWEDGYIKEIDISQMKKLNRLDVNNNYLSSLNTKNNTNLTEIYCGLNYLTSLDLSKNTKLTNLGCRGNYLTKLNVSPLKQLVYLDCRNNQLKALNVSSNTKLGSLICENDLVIDPRAEWPIEFTTFNEIKALDVSNCPELEYLSCQRNGMIMLDLGTNSNLSKLECYGNELTSVYISHCSALVNIYNKGTKDTQPQYYTEYKIDGANYMHVDHGVSIVTFAGVSDHFAAFNGASLSLKDKISVNIYIIIPDTVTGWKANVYYEKDGFKTVKYTYDLKKSASYYSSTGNEYKISFPDISAKELIHHVRVEVINDKGEKVLIINDGAQDLFVSYSAADWANTMIDECETRPAKTVRLAKALLCFGGEAQIYFDYNTNVNVNKAGHLASELSSVNANTLKSFAGVTDANASAVGLDASPLSLSLKSETYLNIYFNNSITATATNLDNAKLTVAKSGSEWVAKITGITAKNLGRQYTITVKGNGKTSTLKYSAMSWAYSVLQKGTNTKALTLAKALYLYQQAAAEYFQ